MFDELLIKRLTLGPGRVPGGKNQQFELSGLTVFVGPNNSGKSLALSEIYQYGNPQPSESWRIATDLEFAELTAQEVEETLKAFKVETLDGNLYPGQIRYRCRQNVYNIAPGELQYAFQNPKDQPQRFRQFYLPNITVNLNGETRLVLCNPKPSGDLLQPDPFNTLQVLFTRDDLRVKVRKILKRAFAKYFIIVPTSQGQLRIAFADREPASPYEEQGLHDEARKYYASVVRHTDGHLFNTARARVTFSRMSVALAVQMKGLGF
jgi:hypothetical protein